VDVDVERLFVVVSGLPAAGKTTVAGPLAEELCVRLVSKDAIKESLFAAVGHGGWEWSKTLSRAADAALARIAEDLDAAVLDNYWHADTVDALLASLPRPIVEVFCRCDPELAFERFRSRTRHPGHADETRDEATVKAGFFGQQLPLGTLGPVVEVDTEVPVVVAELAERVLEAAQAEEPRNTV
jgi:predicted kinase